MGMEGLIKSLSKQVTELGAGEGHVQLENIEGKQGLTAVVSIYDNQKPAHKVLEELYEWAEGNDESLKTRIEEIERDMSWNTIID